MEGRGCCSTSEPNHLARPRGGLPARRWEWDVRCVLWLCDCVVPVGTVCISGKRNRSIDKVKFNFIIFSTLTNNMHHYNLRYLLGLCCCWNCCCMTANCRCGAAALGGMRGCPVVPSGYRGWPKSAGGRPCSWDKSTVWGNIPVQTQSTVYTFIEPFGDTSTFSMK